MTVATALITGITGQDGGYLAEQLVAEGCRVHGVLRPGEVAPAHVLALGPSVTLTEVDLQDRDAISDLLDLADPDELYNFAGLSSVAESWNQPLTTARVNGELVAVLLDLLWQRHTSGRTTRFVQASSAEIFAGTHTSPQSEHTPLQPTSPYGAAKAFAHLLTQTYRARGLHASNAIFYNHESPRRPPAFVTRKITSTVAAIADGRQSELVLGNLHARRDWGWAPEYVEGMTRAARHDEPGDWVFATGIASSVADFVALAFRHVGIEDWRSYLRVDATLVRVGDAPELVGDPTKAREELDWKAQVDLSELVGRMVDTDWVTGPRRATPPPPRTYAAPDQATRVVELTTPRATARTEVPAANERASR
ncbi:MAG: GDPmannose 4,6-dehydratase [Actinomycetota bacterium]|jgi:GDPmannose 4,6-dehydratase|nr:GDPmannose 4,6-dehydratase [Actinomycetota bacterium]